MEAAKTEVASPPKVRKTFDDNEAFVPGRVTHFGSDEGRQETSELSNLRQKESMLIEKAKRIDGMDANQLARDDRNIDELKMRTARQLAEVRKEIARLSK